MSDPQPASAPAADTAEQFAADLRALRLAADSPTLARLERETGVSKTVLSNAFAGKQLPTARTVDRIVRACGGDPSSWVRRRDELAGLHRADDSEPVPAAPNPTLGAGNRPVPQPDPESAPAPAPSVVPTARSMRRGTTLVIAAVAFVLGVVVAAGVSFAVTSSVVEQARAEASEAARKELTDSPVNPRAQINVHNGVDPAMSPCVNDAEVATSSPRTNNTLLEIIWSNKCYAGWARVTRYDEQISGNSIMVAIYPETAPQGPDRQSATEPNVQGAYTTLVVRPTPDTLLCAVGVITLDGVSIDLGEPLCI